MRTGAALLLLLLLAGCTTPEPAPSGPMEATPVPAHGAPESGAVTVPAPRWQPGWTFRTETDYRVSLNTTAHAGGAKVFTAGDGYGRSGATILRVLASNLDGQADGVLALSGDGVGFPVAVRAANLTEAYLDVEPYCGRPPCEPPTGFRIMEGQRQDAWAGEGLLQFPFKTGDRWTRTLEMPYRLESLGVATVESVVLPPVVMGTRFGSIEVVPVEHTVRLDEQALREKAARAIAESGGTFVSAQLSQGSRMVTWYAPSLQAVVRHDLELDARFVIRFSLGDSDWQTEARLSSDGGSSLTVAGKETQPDRTPMEALTLLRRPLDPPVFSVARGEARGSEPVTVMGVPHPMYPEAKVALRNWDGRTVHTADHPDPLLLEPTASGRLEVSATLTYGGVPILHSEATLPVDYRKQETHDCPLALPSQSTACPAATIPVGPASARLRVAATHDSTIPMDGRLVLEHGGDRIEAHAPGGVAVLEVALPVPAEWTATYVPDLGTGGKVTYAIEALGPDA